MDDVGVGCDNCTTWTQSVAANDDGGDKGWVAGVCVGVACLLLCLIALWWRRRKEAPPTPAEEKLVVVDVDNGAGDEDPIWDNGKELALTQTTSELSLKEVNAIERRMERLLNLLPETPLPSLAAQMGGTLISTATHHILRDPALASDSVLNELTANLSFPHQSKMQPTQILYLLMSKLQAVHDTHKYPPMLQLGLCLYPLPGELLDALLLWEDGEPHNEAIYTTWGRWPSLVTAMAAYSLSHPGLPIVVSCDMTNMARKDPAQRVYIPSPVVCTTAEVEESSLSMVCTAYLFIPGTKLVVLPPLTTLTIDSCHYSPGGDVFYEASATTVPVSALMEAALTSLDSDTSRFEAMRGADTFIFDI